MRHGLESLEGVVKPESVQTKGGTLYSAQGQVVRCKAAKAILKRGPGNEDPMRWVGMIVYEIERIAQREVDRGYLER